MEFRKVTAIIQTALLEKVEQALQKAGASGISVMKVKGYGEYANFYSHDWKVSHTRIEIFTSAEKADRLASAIMDAAHTGVRGDGIVAILPVEKVMRIRSRSEATQESL